VAIQRVWYTTGEQGCFLANDDKGQLVGQLLTCDESVGAIVQFCGATDCSSGCGDPRILPNEVSRSLLPNHSSQCGPEVGVCVKIVVPDSHLALLRKIYRGDTSCTEANLVKVEEKSEICDRGTKYWCEEDSGGVSFRSSVLTW
jgi:hypothetical protein